MPSIATQAYFDTESHIKRLHIPPSPNTVRYTGTQKVERVFLQSGGDPAMEDLRVNRGFSP